MSSENRPYTLDFKSSIPTMWNTMDVIFIVYSILNLKS